MAGVSLSGSDTIVLLNRVFNNLADGDCVKVDFPEDVANAEVGKNGNAIFALNEKGRLAEVEMRVLRGSDDDKFLNQYLSNQLNNFPGTVLLSGQFVKQIGNGQGAVAGDTYILGSGIIRKNVPAKDNVAGEVEQSVSVWMFKFAKAVRVITS